MTAHSCIQRRSARAFVFGGASGGSKSGTRVKRSMRSRPVEHELATRGVVGGPRKAEKNMAVRCNNKRAVCRPATYNSQITARYEKSLWLGADVVAVKEKSCSCLHRTSKNCKTSSRDGR